MEWEVFKLIWSSAVTIAVAIFAAAWKVVMDKVQELQNKADAFQKELQRVQVTYVQKEEIHRIESRIDQRFSEMKEFFSEIMRKSHG